MIFLEKVMLMDIIWTIFDFVAFFTIVSIFVYNHKFV